MVDRIDPKLIQFQAKQQAKQGIKGDIAKLKSLGLMNIMSEAVGMNIPELMEEVGTSVVEGGANINRNFGAVSSILEDASDIVARNMASETWTNPQAPQSIILDRYSNRPNMTTYNMEGGWSPQMVIKESSSGKEITKWRAVSPNGKSYVKDYRHRQVAAMVAAALSETNGNFNDPRISKIDALCDQETSLLREIKSLKESAKIVPKGNEVKHDIIETKIETAKVKLENVRLKLGVL